MDNLLKIRLRAVHPELGCDRDYKIRLGIDLFNHWFVTITFGRYRTRGTSKITCFNTKQEAYTFIDHALKRRLSSPKRIGCPYQLVSIDGTDDILTTMDTQVVQRFSWFNDPMLALHNSPPLCKG